MQNPVTESEKKPDVTSLNTKTAEKNKKPSYSIAWLFLLVFAMAVVKSSHFIGLLKVLGSFVVASGGATLTVITGATVFKEKMREIMKIKYVEKILFKNNNMLEYVIGNILSYLFPWREQSIVVLNAWKKPTVAMELIKGSIFETIEKADLPNPFSVIGSNLMRGIERYIIIEEHEEAYIATKFKQELCEAVIKYKSTATAAA